MTSIEIPIDGEGRSLSFQDFCFSAHLLPLCKKILFKMKELKIKDYRIKIVPKDSSFVVMLKYVNLGEKRGPRSFDFCLSCDPDKAYLSENNYEGGESMRGPPERLPSHLKDLKSSLCEWRDEEVKDSSTKMWMDAQARPLFIITPTRHVGSMEEMTDEEIISLWSKVGTAIGLGFNKEKGKATFKEVVLNAGDYRNIEHLHIKCWFEGSDFIDRVSRWSPEKQLLHSHLHELRRLMKLPDESILLPVIDGEEGAVELLVKGTFTVDDIEELQVKFGKFGKVISINLKDGRFRDGIVVTMENSTAAIEAIKELNLTKIGKGNVMSKVKLVKALLG